MVYLNTTHLSTIISENPSILSLLNRLGIFLGVGNSSVSQAAKEHHIDDDFLLAMINTYLNHNYFPEKDLLKVPISKICDYLRLTNNFYMEVQLPNVIRHFKYLVERSSSSENNLQRLFDFFLSLESRIREVLKEYNELLNRIIKIHNTQKEELADYLHKFAEEKMHPATDALNDIINLFIIHLKGSYDANLCHAVINAMISLAKDMRQNNRIFDRILTPLSLI